MRRLPLRFAWALAWRETRGGSSEFLALVACVALGVAALASVGSLGSGLERALGREARALLGGDVEARSYRPLDPPAAQALAELEARGATVARVRELVAMARDPKTGRSLLVELKAPDPTYPLYGALEASPADALGSLLGGGGVVVGADLLSRLELRVGDRLGIGGLELTIRGVVSREPDRPASLVTLGPRVLIAPESLDASGLVAHGSRVRYRTLVRAPGTMTAGEARTRVIAAIPDPSIRVVTFDEAQPGVRRFFAQVTAYLGLVGLTTLLVGGIGVAAAVTTFLRRRVAAVAILKTLGAESRTLVLAYLVQAQALGLIGSVIGAIVGSATAPLLGRALTGVLPLTLDIRPEPWTLVRAIAMGLGTTMLCALWPLLKIRSVRPSLVLRSEIDPVLPGARRPWHVALPLALGLAGLAVWQAGSFKLGLIFVGAAVGALGVLAGLARLVSFAARRARGARGVAWRHGLAGLSRPGGQSAVVVVALGIAVMLLTAIVLLERSLVRELDAEQRREAPSFFFVDVQPDQAASFAAVVKEAGGTAPALTSVVRGRLAAIDGTAVTRTLVEQRPRERMWYFTRDYVLTTGSAPPAGNALVRGRWWTAEEAAARPRVSVEEDAARALGIGVGSRLTFDVQGVPVETEVMSVRIVDWQSLTMNFFMILSPGALEGAPGTFVATARVARADETRLQDSVVRSFPNVTAIAVREVLERVADVLDRLARAVRAIAAFSLAAGLVVIVATLAASRYQRLYESAVLRTLGARRVTVARAFAVEYGCLGAAAGVGGAALAALLAWIVLHFILDMPWRVESAALAVAVAATTIVALSVGFLGTFKLLGEKPLALLRRD